VARFHQGASILIDFIDNGSNFINKLYILSIKYVLDGEEKHTGPYGQKE